MEHHPTLAPSSFPKLEQCACFRSQPGGEVAERGRVRHLALADLFWTGRTGQVDLTKQERDGIAWAAKYIEANCTLAEMPRFEFMLRLLDDDFNELTHGTPDCVCGPDLFDLKWHEDNYSAQMACYALMRMQETGFASITVHLLFADVQKAVKYTISEAAARQIVVRIIHAVLATNRQPTPNDCCTYCADKLTCPALNNMAMAVVAGREDWGLENYHPSQITDPVEMGKARKIAGAIEKWCAAVKFHSNQMARGGVQIPGFKLQDDKGDRFVPDVNAAHARMGLPTEKFLACVEAVTGRLITAYAEHFQVGLKEADRMVEELIGPLPRKNPSQYLVKVRSKKQSIIDI